MTDSRENLEKRLLREPFNADLRGRYAACLFDAGEYAGALEQWRLLLEQPDAGADACLGAALCCLRLEDRHGAEAYLERARGCADFDPDDARLAQLGGDAGRVRFRVVAGGRPDAPSRGEVVSIGSTDKVRFSDVVGMKELKTTVRLRIIEPFVNPGLFQRFRKQSGGGVLLYGPPGCGKTMIARAIATECRAPFTAVGISDILNKWMGQSEQNLAAIFAKARAEAPSVLFFDELDALAFSRSKAISEHTRTLVNEFLAQFDGMSGNNEKVLILAATNMPWDVDEAMKRPGRFDRQVFVPPPDAEARSEMFRLKLIGVPCDPIDADSLGGRATHFSGADIDGVIEQAKENVLGDILESGQERTLRERDLLTVIEQRVPSTLEWLNTARTLVKFGGGSQAYKDVERYLRSVKLY